MSWPKSRYWHRDQAVNMNASVIRYDVKKSKIILIMSIVVLIPSKTDDSNEIILKMIKKRRTALNVTSIFESESNFMKPLSS